MKSLSIEIGEPRLSKFLFSDTRFSWAWLLLRLYVGYEWITAGWGKATSGWLGGEAGTAIQGFFAGAIGKASGAHPAVSAWYAYFLNNIAAPHAALFSYLITFGELAV